MKKKTLAFVLCAALISVAMIGGTLAYFTDTTVEKENTFTIGKVEIDLDEPNWDEDGDHTLMPDKEISKDPTITIDENSQDCWIFLDVKIEPAGKLLELMRLEDGNYEDFDDFFAAISANPDIREPLVDKWVDGIEHKNWKVLDQIKDEANDSLTLRLGYKDYQSAGDEIKFMENIHMPKGVTQEMIEASGFSGEFKLIFTAYAIQKTELETLDDAYNAMFPAS